MSEIKVPSRVFFSISLLVLQGAMSSHMAFSLCMQEGREKGREGAREGQKEGRRERERGHPGVSSFSSKDTSPIGVGPTLIWYVLILT